MARKSSRSKSAQPAPDVPSAASPVPAAYNPKKELFNAFPKMKAFAASIDRQLEDFGDELAERENRGVDTSYARSILYEVRWRQNNTSDADAADSAMTRLTDGIDVVDPPGALEQEPSGSFARGTEVFFLKLDRSTDQLLGRQWPWKIAPYFLEQIDDPTRMFGYLQDLTWCDVARRGCDTRKELNLAVSVIARLVLRGGQAGYLSGPGFIPALERFTDGWRDPDTHFYGVTYITDANGSATRTRDLSLTFHMARYLPHLVPDWARLVDTLLSLQDGAYPQGWLDGGKTMSNHNNYDVAEILRRGWRLLRPDQRVRASALIREMADFCLRKSLDPDGEVREPDSGDMVPDSFYFAAAFLDTVGLFDRSKCFWTDTPPEGVKAVQEGMIRRVQRFNPRLSVVADTLERLGGRRRPISNAVL